MAIHKDHQDALVSCHPCGIEAEHIPTPEMQLVQHPNGKDQIGVVRDGWKAQVFTKPPVGVRKHRFDDIESFADWLKAWFVVEPKGTAEILVGEKSIGAVKSADSPLSSCHRAANLGR